MSEESQEGGMSSIKKTIIGLVTTVVTAAGAYVTTQFNEIFGIEEEEKTEVVAPVQQAPAPVVVNVENNSTNSNQGGGNTVIKEKTIVEKPVKEEKSESEDAPW